MAANDTPMVPQKGQAGLALLVAIALGLALATWVIVCAFTAHNTRASIDGHKAVYSHNLP